MNCLSQDIDFLADVVQFSGTNGKTSVEFNYAFSDTTITYALKPSGFEGELFCALVYRNAVGDSVVDQWLTGSKATSKHPPHKQHYTGVRKTELEPGTWQCSLLVTDVADSTRILRSSFEVRVRDFGLRLALSDIMFTLPHSAVVGKAFYRNGVDAAPNPRAEMVGTDPSISMYAECYNAVRNNLDTMTVRFTVQNSTQTEMMTSYARLLGKSNGLVIREDIPGGALRTGVYTLVVSILSEDMQTELATSQKRFYILNPELPPFGDVLLTEEQRFLTSEWADCTGDRLRTELEVSDLLATPAERITLADLQDNRAKQRYLYRFWQVRDPDPSTPQNERLDEVRKMKDRANGFYTPNTKREGWKTDRGKVLIRLGVPTQVTQHIQDLDTKPYEEWFYQGIQGGVYFYFVDMHLMQDHKLVHSTMLGEIRNENWYNLYAKAFSPNPNPTESLTPSNR